MADDNLLQAVIDTAIDGLILIDARGRVALFNPACEALFGYRPEEVIGRNVSMLMPEPDRSAHDGYLHRYHDTGEKRIIGIGREVLGRRRDGSVFPFQLAVGEFERDGQPMFVGVIHDQSHWRASEEAQRQSEQRFRMLVDAVEDYAILLLDADGRIVSWNTGAERIKGYSAAEAIGQPLSLFYTPEQKLRGDPERTLAAAREDGRFSTEDWRLRKDGSRFWANVLLVALRDGEGNLTGYTKITRDATARRQAEEVQEQLRQAQKMEALGQLTGGIAHDFNNLLAVIVGNLELLGDRVNDTASQHLIEQAMRNATRGAELTQRLLAFGRRQKLKPSRIDVNSQISAMTDMLRRTLGDVVQVEVALTAKLPPVEADAGQLENAVLNIALNARDAMPQGGSLSIRTGAVRLSEPRIMPTRTAEPGDYVLIALRDSGTGMPPEVRDRVFEPFYTTKDIGKGTGLGLSMVYGFVVQSGGYVEIDSAPGKGTELRLYLPAIEPLPETQAGPETRPVVLCVEDNPDVRMMMVSMLDSIGYAVLPAANAIEALARLQQGGRIDLMLSDVMMPGGIDGIALADQVQALRPGLPVLFMSGSADQDRLRHTRFVDATKILPKPVRKAQLVEALAAMLATRP